MATPLQFTTPAPPLVNGQTPSADVSYTTVPGLPPLPLLGSLRNEGWPYLGYGCTITYDFDSGLVGQQTAGPKGSATRIIRRSGGSCVKTVNVVAIRPGQKPALPAFTPGNANEVLLRRAHTNFSPAKFPDGTPLFAFICQYVYQLQFAPGDNDQLDMGTEPVDMTSASAYTLNPSDFVQYLLGAGSPVSGANPVTVNY